MAKKLQGDTDYNEMPCLRKNNKIANTKKEKLEMLATQFESQSSDEHHNKCFLDHKYLCESDPQFGEDNSPPDTRNRNKQITHHGRTQNSAAPDQEVNLFRT